MFGFVFHIYQLVLLNVLLFQIHALSHAACVADMTALQVVGTLCAVQADFSGTAVELANNRRLFLAILFGSTTTTFIVSGMSLSIDAVWRKP